MKTNHDPCASDPPHTPTATASRPPLAPPAAPATPSASSCDAEAALGPSDPEVNRTPNTVCARSKRSWLGGGVATRLGNRVSRGWAPTGIAEHGAGVRRWRSLHSAQRAHSAERCGDGASVGGGGVFWVWQLEEFWAKVATYWWYFKLVWPNRGKGWRMPLEILR